MTAAENEAFAKLPETERVRTLIMLARGGRHEIAAELLAKYPLTGRFAKNRTLFLEGLILKAQGHLPAAVEKFRAALAADSGLTMVRAELAHTLYLLGEDDGAKHHLELLRGAAPTSEQARDITSFIEAIDARRPVRISAYVGLSPSTNINNGSGYTLTIGGLPYQFAKEESGIGVELGLNAAYHKELNDKLSAVVAFGANALQYEGNEFDQLSVSETAEIRHKTRAGYIGVGGLASQSLFGELADISTLMDFNGDISSWSAGPRFTLFHGIAPDLSFDADLTVLRQEYSDGSSYYNGWHTAIAGRLNKAFASDLTGYVRAGVERNRTDSRDDLDYWAFFGSAGVYKELPYGVTTSGEVRVRRQIYDENYSALVPQFAKPHRDTLVGTTVSVWKRDFDILGYSPVIEYTFTWNSSNIGIFDYTSHTVDFRLTKEF